MKMFYRLILLNIYEDGRISNQTSIHPTEENACRYAQDCLKVGSSDGFVILEECKDDWNVVISYLDTTRYEVTQRNGVPRIERVAQLQPV